MEITGKEKSALPLRVNTHLDAAGYVRCRCKRGVGIMDYLYKISDANALINAFRKASKNSGWKESVQRYELNLLENVYETQKEIRSGTYSQKPFFQFNLTERGRVRPIKSMHIKDRVVQRTICDNALTPMLQKYLIYDNGASIKGKGVDFTRRRLETHLHRFYRETGSNEGYILLWDFNKFFDNIPHEKLIAAMAEKIKDQDFISFLKEMVRSFEIDVSYMSNEEYEHCMEDVYNSVKYRRLDQRLLTGEKWMAKSVGIGSQISQICGVFYPTRLDTYCKVVKGMKYYGRYMDDIYVIDRSKEHLRELLDEMMEVSAELGLPVNTKKTQIVKLSHGFTFLKIRYALTETGHVLKRVSPERLTRERRRLKKFRRLMDEGKMPYKDIELAYKSWRGGIKKYSTYRSLKNMDKLYDELFIKPFINQEK